MTITRRIAFVLLLAFGLAQGAIAQRVETVHLVVDYGDGAMKIINDIPWTQGSVSYTHLTLPTKRIV